METVRASRHPPTLPSWREVMWPKEHGSWSLALEPVALGLLVAPSWGGAALAIAVIAGFFSRRPLRLAIVEAKTLRRQMARRMTMACGAVALSGWFGALAVAGPDWCRWLLPTAAAGGVFLYFDLQQAGREQYAEIAGAAAFGWLPAVFAALDGRSAATALAVAGVMLARTVPTVLTVRAWIRNHKNGVRHVAGPLAAAGGAALIVIALARTQLVPWAAAVLISMLAVRSAVLLVFPKPNWRAAKMGMIEAAFGVGFVLAVGIAWHV